MFKPRLLIEGAMMSMPDYILLQDRNAPPRFDGFPHRLILRPVDAVRCGHQTGIFLIEPGCANETLGDPALNTYLDAKIPVAIHARRARDLRPFLRRADSFRRRGFAVEVLP